MAEILHFEILRKHGQTNKHTHTQTNTQTNKQTWALQYLALPLWGRGKYNPRNKPKKHKVTIDARYRRPRAHNPDLMCDLATRQAHQLTNRQSEMADLARRATSVCTKFHRDRLRND